MNYEKKFRSIEQAVLNKTGLLRTDGKPLSNKGKATNRQKPKKRKR